MNEIEINYSYSKNFRILLLAAGGYITAYGVYLCVKEALKVVWDVDFYLALAAALVGVVLILSATLWAPKPILSIDSETIFIGMPKQKSIYMAEWSAIKSVGIGVGYLKFSETDDKEYTINIGGLKYDDLKAVKSAIIEYCEAKSIPYGND